MFIGFPEDRSFTPDPIESAAAAFQQESPSTSATFFNEAKNGLTQKAGSFLAENVVHGADAFSNAFDLNLPKTQKLSAQDVNSMAPIGNDGKQVHITDDPMYENIANMIIKDKQRELVNESMTAKYANANGIIPSLAVGAAAFMADPSNLAATAYGGAVLGSGKVLTGLGSMGVDTSSIAARVGARVVSGAVGGAASMVPLAGAQFGISAYQGGDYDMRSALSDIAFGGVAGALMHGGFGSALHESGVLNPDELMKSQNLKDNFSIQAADLLRSPAPVKEAGINSTIADIVNGRPTDPESVIGRGGQPPDLAQIANDRNQQNANGFSPNMTQDEIAQAKKSILPDGIKVEPKPSRIPEEEISRYKPMVQQELAKVGIGNVDDSVVREIARIKAEALTPESPVKTKAQPVATTLKATVSPEPKKPVLQSAPEVFPNLPRALSGAKTGYQKARLQFASDVDRALYVVREKSSGTSKSHDKYIDYLKKTAGLSDDEIKSGSQKVYETVKQNAEGKNGKVDIPRTFERSAPVLTPEDIAANKKMQEKINRSEGAKNRKEAEPKNIFQSIAQAGGLRDEGGFLKSRDMRSVMTQHGRLYQKKGMTYEEAYDHAAGKNFIEQKEYDPNNPETVNKEHALFDALEKEHFSKKPNASAYEDDLERHAGEMGIDTTGMKPEEIRDALERRTKEAAHELNALDELREDRPELIHDYYPDMDEPYDETTFESAHSGNEPEVSASHERSTSETGNTRSVQGAQPINTSDVGRGARTTETAKPVYERIAGIDGEQAVIPGAEQSAKQAMESRGEKIQSKVEQKAPDEGLFAHSVIGGGDELDLRIAQAEKSLSSSAMLPEAKLELQQAYKEADEADKFYSEKMKELGQCLDENGI